MGEARTNEKVPRDNLEMLFAAVMPNAKVFESRFDALDMRIGVLEKGQTEFKEQMRHFEENVDNRFNSFKQDVRDRFEQVDKRFEQVDKRFEQVDQRFEKVDKSFEQVDQRLVQIAASIDKLGDKLDYRDEKQRSFTIRMFTIAVGIFAVGIGGMVIKALG